MTQVADLQDHLEAIDGVIARCRRLERDLNRSRRAEATLREKVELLIAEKSGLEESILHIESVHGKAGVCSAAPAVITSHNSHVIRELNNRITDLEQTKQLLEQQVDDYRQRLSRTERLQDKIAGDAPRLRQSQRVAQQMEVQLAETRSKLEAALEKNEELRNKVSAKESKLKSLKVCSQNKDMKNAELHEEIEKIRDELQSVTLERNTKQHDLKGKCRELSELQEKINTLKQSLVDTRTRNHQLREERKSEVDMLKAKLLKAEGDWCSEREEYRMKIDQEQERIKELQRELTNQESAHRKALRVQEENLSAGKVALNEALANQQQEFDTQKDLQIQKLQKLQEEWTSKLAQADQVRAEERDTHRKYWKEFTERFEQKSHGSEKVIRMLETQIKTMENRFQEATESLKEAGARLGSRGKNKGVPLAEYSALLVELSQKEAAIKVMKSDIKGLRLRNKASLKRTPSTSDENDSFSMFEIRDSTIWAVKIQQLETEVKDTKVQLDLARKTAEDFDVELSRTKNENESLLADLSKARKKIQQQKKLRDKAEETLNRVEMELEDQEGIEGLRQEIVNWRRQYKKLKESLKRKDEIISSLKKKKNELRDQKSELEARAILMSPKSVQSQQSRTQREQLGRKDKIIKDLREKLKGLRVAGDEIQKAKTTLCDTIKSLSTDVQRKDNMIRNFRQKIEELEDKLKRKPVINPEKFEKLEVKCRRLKADLARKDNIVRSTKTRVKVLNKEIEEAALKHGELTQKLDKKSGHEKLLSKNLEEIFSILGAIAADLEKVNRNLRKEEQMTRKVTLISSASRTPLNPSFATPESGSLSRYTITKRGRGISKTLRDFTESELRELIGSVKRTPENGDSDYVVPTVQRPSNVDQDAAILCDYICRLMEERIALEVGKALRCGRREPSPVLRPRSTIKTDIKTLASMVRDLKKQIS